MPSWRADIGMMPRPSEKADTVMSNATATSMILTDFIVFLPVKNECTACYVSELCCDVLSGAASPPVLTASGRCLPQHRPVVSIVANGGCIRHIPFAIVKGSHRLAYHIAGMCVNGGTVASSSVVCRRHPALCVRPTSCARVSRFGRAHPVTDRPYSSRGLSKSSLWASATACA